MNVRVKTLSAPYSVRGLPGAFRDPLAVDQEVAHLDIGLDDVPGMAPLLGKRAREAIHVVVTGIAMEEAELPD